MACNFVKTRKKERVEEEEVLGMPVHLLTGLPRLHIRSPGHIIAEMVTLDVLHLIPSHSHPSAGEASHPAYVCRCGLLFFPLAWGRAPTSQFTHMSSQFPSQSYNHQD